MTVKELRDLLEEVDDEQPVLACLCGLDDAAKLFEAAEANDEGELMHVRVPSPLQVAGGFQNDEGGVMLFVYSPESQEEE
jgi:hypothetical protein